MDIPREPAPSRSATLPPYSSVEQEGKQKDWDIQPQTPDNIFGIPLEPSPGDKSKNNADACGWPFPIVASPEAGPVSPSKRISSTLSLDGPFTPSGTRSGTASSSSRSPFASPDLPSRDSTERFRQGSVSSEFSLDNFSSQYLLQDLKNTSMCVSSLFYPRKATQLTICHQQPGQEEPREVPKTRKGDRDFPQL